MSSSSRNGHFNQVNFCLYPQVRTDSYRDALEKNPSLTQGKLVLDVGCGTGILSMFAARGGAAHVVGIDGSERIAAVAREIIKANGFAGGDVPRIQVVTGMLENIQSLPFEKAREKPARSPAPGALRSPPRCLPCREA